MGADEPLLAFLRLRGSRGNMPGDVTGYERLGEYYGAPKLLTFEDTESTEVGKGALQFLYGGGTSDIGFGCSRLSLLLYFRHWDTEALRRDRERDDWFKNRGGPICQSTTV